MSRVAYSSGEDSLVIHRVSVCELLDRVLNKGVVLTGEVVISVANIELLYIAVNLLISSVETLLNSMSMDGRQVEGGGRKAEGGIEDR